MHASMQLYDFGTRKNIAATTMEIQTLKYFLEIAREENFPSAVLALELTNQM